MCPCRALWTVPENTVSGVKRKVLAPAPRQDELQVPAIHSRDMASLLVSLAGSIRMVPRFATGPFSSDAFYPEGGTRHVSGAWLADARAPIITAARRGASR